VTLPLYTRRPGVLWSLLLPAAAYLWWQYDWWWLTGRNVFDGSVGVLLGLFICSRPAANSIDLFFLDRGALKRALATRGAAGWLLLNGFVMLVGWLVIVVGVSRFSAPAS
jgi:hypothetical protein